MNFKFSDFPFISSTKMYRFLISLTQFESPKFFIVKRSILSCKRSIPIWLNDKVTYMCKVGFSWQFWIKIFSLLHSYTHIHHQQIRKIYFFLSDTIRGHFAHIKSEVIRIVWIFVVKMASMLSRTTLLAEHLLKTTSPKVSEVNFIEIVWMWINGSQRSV